jgi:Ni/Co efflux regulator RcnB
VRAPYFAIHQFFSEVTVKKKQIVAVVLFAGLGLSSLAMAQNGPGGPGGPGQQGGPDYRGGPQGQQQQRPGNPPGMVGHNGGGIQNPNYARPGDGRSPQANNGRPPMQANGGQHWNGPRDWHRGDRIPNDYRNRQYVIDDYRGYGLNRPQRGYQWIGVNGDYALVAIASGIIAQVVINGR